ncbi:MAG: hypothetical protein JXR44_07725 [Thiotrichales bacterium]|nr:hypothetical protein [Thiotrichales bacterium]
MGNWAFNWVQLLSHNLAALGRRFVALACLMLLGLFTFDWSALLPHAIWLFVALLLSSLLFAWQAESLRTALVLFCLMSSTLLLLFGLMGWLSLSLPEQGILPLLVVMMMTSANLVHLLNTLLKEMARGLFQFDALAEALKLNLQPIWLSNLTTVVGFAVAAWLNPAWETIAWIVLLGALLNGFLLLTFLPLILLRYFLEFRVGNSRDREGLRSLMRFLNIQPRWRKVLIVLSLAGFVLLLSVHWPLWWQSSFILLLGVFALLFQLYWRRMIWVGMALWLVTLAWLLALSLGRLLPTDWLIHSDWVLSSLLMMGLVVDEAVHFFSRFVRAQRSVFGQSAAAVRYAMASVGRPIWITTCLQSVMLGLLLFHSDPVLQGFAWLGLFGLWSVTFLVLLWLPILLAKPTLSPKNSP